MITKELIQAELDKLDEKDLNELYNLIKQFTQIKQEKKPTLMSKLRKIKVNAPEDFAASHELYANGEKSF